METTYRLEFNEKQQRFHLDNFTHTENTNGWVTIFDHCTDLEFRIYESYVNRIKKEKLTEKYLRQCTSELKGFISNLKEWSINISHI